MTKQEAGNEPGGFYLYGKYGMFASEFLILRVAYMYPLTSKLEFLAHVWISFNCQHQNPKYSDYKQDGDKVNEYALISGENKQQKRYTQTDLHLKLDNYTLQ